MHIRIYRVDLINSAHSKSNFEVELRSWILNGNKNVDYHCSSESSKKIFLVTR
jgi:hypothetical protein